MVSPNNDGNFITVPTWDNGEWLETVFETRDEFRDFVLSVFKEPGKYEFDETSLIFNEQARFFNTNQYFCTAPYKSKDYKKYWDDQKNKCRKGVIFKNNDKVWYLSRDYYMWLNFLPINNKELRRFSFADVRDAQYHMALYEILAELHYKHVAILKKRQIASSYFHMAKLINQIWFEETPILKMGASLKDYINEKGSWKFLDEYRNFLDLHTAWIRPMNPGKTLIWQQQIEETINGRKTKTGLKGVLQGMSFEKDPTNGVGGPCTYFFYEEGGIAPTADLTYGYMRPAMKSGMITTGLFIIAGSVGDLSQCGPLKKFILNPDINDIYSVETDLINNKRIFGKSGLFIPEQWSMPPYIDKYGNSLVEESLQALDEYFEKCKANMDPRDYQLEISQHPRTIEEAFANREESIFPTPLVNHQIKLIEDKEYSVQYVDLVKTLEGKFEFKSTSKLPIKDFPVDKKMIDKSGVIVITEKPDPNASWGTYYASIDPVGEGKTTTSESLCSIYIYKNPVEVTKIEGDETTVYVERDRIVAWWCGRFDDINKTHERLEHMIEAYNAWTIVESNVSLFIRHMIFHKKQKYLVPKDQITFLKDLGSNKNVYQEYGWKNTGQLFKAHMLSYLIEFIKETIDEESKTDGTIVKKYYGIERIPDIMAMKEMLAYVDGLNVDRLVSLAALISFAKVQISSLGYKKRIDRVQTTNFDKSNKMSKLSISPFRHIGGKSRGLNSIKRNPFKNIR
jgi:hypothetical protein